MPGTVHIVSTKCDSGECNYIVFYSFKVLALLIIRIAIKCIIFPFHR